MKILTSVCYYIFASLIPLGLIFRTIAWETGSNCVFLGLLGLFTFFIAKTIKALLSKQLNKANAIIQILIILMSITFYDKYLYFTFWDYPGMIITPIFIAFAIFYLFKSKTKELKITLTSVLYLLLVIPLIGFDYYGAPNNLSPSEWRNRYDVEQSASIDLPNTYEFHETQQLSEKAHDLKKSKRYSEAINMYQQAMKIEPRNPALYFDLSECYARINNLEYAKTLLDTAILLDSNFAGLYSNRGLIFYKLNENKKAIKDYKRAILLDSTKFPIFVNLALVYYYERKFDSACKALHEAERLGYDLSDLKELRNDINIYCK